MRKTDFWRSIGSADTRLFKKKWVNSKDGSFISKYAVKSVRDPNRPLSNRRGQYAPSKSQEDSGRATRYCLLPLPSSYSLYFLICIWAQPIKQFQIFRQNHASSNEDKTTSISEERRSNDFDFEGVIQTNQMQGPKKEQGNPGDLIISRAKQLWNAKLVGGYGAKAEEDRNI